MHEQDKTFPALPLSLAALRPLGSMLLLAAIATLALFGAATVATLGG